jgi:tryptophan synthase alpha chain
MATIAASFARAKAQHRLALIGYLPAGFPDEATFIALAHQAFRSGLDILEIGLPSADPYLDGEVIRAAVQQTVAHGLDTRRALQLGGLALEGMNGAGVAMFYPPSLEGLGVDGLLQACREVQIGGLLPVGMEAAERRALAQRGRSAGLDAIGFITFGMEAPEVEQVAQAAGGFLYLQSQDGPTGQQGAFGDEVRQRIAQVRDTVGERLPLAVGFGVRDAVDVQRIRSLGADGVIVGTALVEAAAQGTEAVAALVGELAQAARFTQEE